jgi:hypothetical protein
MRRAVTGPSQDLNGAMDWEIRYFMTWDLKPKDKLYSGCAYGVDSVVLRRAYRELPTVKRIGVPPNAPHNEHILGICDEIINVPNSQDDWNLSSAYRARNTLLVNECDILHAFLWSPEFYRSGEWMTVNIARRLKKEVKFHVVEKT